MFLSDTIDEVHESKKEEIKDHPLSQWFKHFSEEDELSKLAAARQQVIIFYISSNWQLILAHSLCNFISLCLCKFDIDHAFGPHAFNNCYYYILHTIKYKCVICNIHKCKTDSLQSPYNDCDSVFLILLQIDMPVLAASLCPRFSICIAAWVVIYYSKSRM